MARSYKLSRSAGNIDVRARGLGDARYSDEEAIVASRIEDYALIGDCQTAALVGRDGSIDWLCFPRFDSGACFAALLGTPDHGRWLLAPAAEVKQVRRCYRPGTLVLETEYEVEGGVVRLVDCMPPRSDTPDLVRMVVGVRGRVAMRMHLVIRFARHRRPAPRRGHLPRVLVLARRQPGAPGPARRRPPLLRAPPRAAD